MQTLNKRPTPGAFKKLVPGIPEPTSLLLIGTFFLLLELGIQLTRFFDFYLVGLRIPMFVFMTLLLCLFFNLPGQLRNLTRRTPGLMLVALFWLCFTTVFSTWRSNSLVQLTSYVYLSMVGVGIMLLIDTPRLYVKILSFFGLFYFCAAMLSFLVANPGSPRLELYQGSYADPNLYALSLLTGVPVVWWSMNFAKNIGARILALLASFFMIWVLLKTGSRGAFISLVVILLFTFIYSTVTQKLFLLMGLVGLLFGGSLFLSTYAKKRLVTLFDSSSDASESELMTNVERESIQGDIGSSESRWNLFKDSIEISIKHPIVGVGPGNFGDFRWTHYLEQSGRKTSAQTTHNTYTQFSSEAGIIALFLFLLQIGDAFRNLRVVRKWNTNDGYQPPKRLVGAAIYLRFSLIGACIGMFFLSLAYSGPFGIIFGLTFALRNTVERDWERHVAAMGKTGSVPAPGARAKPIPTLQPAFRMR